MAAARTSKTNPPAAAKAHRQQKGTAERREAILRAATKVFASRGFHNASLVEIADEAGMTHSGVIHHFGNKEQLLIAVLAYRDDDDVVRFEGHKAPEGAAFLDHLVLTAKENTRRPGIVQGYAVLSAESVTDDHPAQDYFRDRFTGLRTMLTHALDAVTVGELPPPVIARAAQAIVATMDGLQVQWLLDPDVVDMPAALELTIDAVVRQLSSLRTEARPRD
jgi:AcrR family transcriptional regulator